MGKKTLGKMANANIIVLQQMCKVYSIVNSSPCGRLDDSRKLSYLDSHLILNKPYSVSTSCCFILCAVHYIHQITQTVDIRIEQSKVVMP